MYQKGRKLFETKPKKKLTADDVDYWLPASFNELMEDEKEAGNLTSMFKDKKLNNSRFC